ncbi:UDP-galactopyranose mutase [Breznakiellaceae bacterium SP9]
MPDRVKNLVVGAGLSGSVTAERLAARGEKVLVIDRREHIAGNCYDYKVDGITVHKYGAHIFHTNNKTVWDYLSRFTKWRPFCNKVLAFIDNNHVPIPFNLNTMRALFPPELASRLCEKLIEDYGFGTNVPIAELRKNSDKDIKFLSEYVYKKVFEGYTTKQWGIKPDEIDPYVLTRVPVSISRDDGYFHDKYQAIPAEGYTKLLSNILDHPLIEVCLDTDFSKINIEYENLYYSGAIDEFFAYKYGELPYRSLRFATVRMEKEYEQATAVVNYPCNYDFTRIIEHKYFLDEKAQHTVLSVEYPETFEKEKNERYYPIENPVNRGLYEKYLARAHTLPNVRFLGRLGNYKYHDMDDVVMNVLESVNHA